MHMQQWMLSQQTTDVHPSLLVALAAAEQQLAAGTALDAADEHGYTALHKASK